MLRASRHVHALLTLLSAALYFRAMLILTGHAEATVIPLAPGEYRQAALLREGDSRQGQWLFQQDSRLQCARCHSTDGSASRAGPDLFAVGDKYGRLELIDSVLLPSAVIAVGYSATTVETQAGDELSGIVKEASAGGLVLMGADAQQVRIARAEIASERTSDVSLMPEGLHAGLSLAEFTDLIEYLVTLKQPEAANLVQHGMPREIPEVEHSVRLQPLFDETQRFVHPVWFGPMPGESNVFLVVEHESGRIWRLDRTGQEPLKTLVLDTGVYQKGTRGLIGMALHPQFQTTRSYFVAKHQVHDGQFTTSILQYKAAPDLRRDSGEPPRLILRIEEATGVHYGGGLQFGPDGYLYIGMGDSGPQGDPQGHGQNTRLWLGKILRIDIDHQEHAPYAVPHDNPFLANPAFLPEIWAFGFREPWRFSFDSVTGELWVGDVGQDRYEEVDIVHAGENYGWNVYEGFERFSSTYRRSDQRFIPPVFSYPRKFGASVTGGYVYRGDPSSNFYGVYIFGDYQSRRIFGLRQQNYALCKVRQLGVAPQPIVSFAQDARGELYVVGYEGMIYRLELAGASFETP